MTGPGIRWLERRGTGLRGGPEGSDVSLGSACSVNSEAHIRCRLTSQRQSTGEPHKGPVSALTRSGAPVVMPTADRPPRRSISTTVGMVVGMVAGRKQFRMIISTRNVPKKRQVQHFLILEVPDWAGFVSGTQDCLRPSQLADEAAARRQGGCAMRLRVGRAAL